MPRYFFDVRDREELLRDDDGVELQGPDQLRDAAVAVLIELAYEAGASGSTRTVMLTIRDEDGQHVLEASLPVITS